MSHRLLPLFADLNARRVLLVGAGSVAARKLASLRDAGAAVVIGARDFSPEIRRVIRAHKLETFSGDFAEHWLEGVWLVIAATNDEDTNARIAAAAAVRRIFVNVVDDAARSSVQLPAVVKRGLLQIAISSAGAAPMLARQVREQIESLFDDSWGRIAYLLEKHRAQIRTKFPDLSARRRWFSQLLRGALPRLARARDEVAAEAHLQLELQQADSGIAAGSVALVGAGPGDAGLLTLRALRVLNEADVILHDQLVSADVLALARRDARFIDVGKHAGAHAISQDAINALMIEHAQRGAMVVRLKGGDPFVFGRGGEELQALRAAGVAYEVVPGITAAIACAAYAGIPLTHREHAQSVRLVTAHCERSADRLDWVALAQERQTLAFYMGVAGLERIRDRLITHGRSSATPFALIENGSRANQRVVVGALDRLPETARQHNVQTPALLIIGEVAALARELHWFGAAPIVSIDAPSVEPIALDRAA